MSRIHNKRAMELPSRKLVLLTLMVVVIALVIVFGITNFVDTVRTGISDVKTASGEYYEEYKNIRGISGSEQFEEEGAEEANLDQINAIDQFSQRNNVDKAKLMAIIDVESGKRSFYEDGHPVVRFECVRYNARVEESQRVPCDVSQYPYGSAEDTGREAFERALEIDRSETLLQSSYGFAQILGESYNLAGFSNVEKLYENMFSEKGQTEAFLSFISNKNGGIILEELQKEEPNWATIAYNYNGPRYEDNNYDDKLIAAYQRNLEIYG